MFRKQDVSLLMSTAASHDEAEVVRRLVEFTGFKRVSFFQASFTAKGDSHIVADRAFPVVNRTIEAKQIAKSMQWRKDRNTEEKALNPLIALSGSLGIGKSTFFAHFAESAEFRQ